jgi:hypothetical protein
MPSQLPLRTSVGILLMALVILQVECRAWIEKPIVPDTGTMVPQRGLLRVTMTDSAKITLRDAVVRSDSIVGFYSDAPTVRDAIARIDVAKIESRIDTTPRWIRIVLVYEAIVMIVGGVALAVAYGFPVR